MANIDRRGMPSKAKIQKHWAAELVRREKFISEEEVFEDDYCFACGMIYVDDWRNTERAHIVPLWDGGGNLAENLHNLCRRCHKSSECLTGCDYWNWFDARHYFHVLMEGYLELPGATHAQWKTGDVKAIGAVMAAHYRRLNREIPDSVRAVLEMGQSEEYVSLRRTFSLQLPS